MQQGYLCYTNCSIKKTHDISCSYTDNIWYNGAFFIHLCLPAFCKTLLSRGYDK